MAHRKTAVYFEVLLALNIGIIIKIQKAEGFWQSSRVISNPTFEIVLWSLLQHWELSSGSDCSKGLPRCNMSNKEENTKNLYSLPKIITQWICRSR